MKESPNERPFVTVHMTNLYFKETHYTGPNEREVGRNLPNKRDAIPLLNINKAIGLKRTGKRVGLYIHFNYR